MIADSPIGPVARPDREGPVIHVYTCPSRTDRGGRLRAVTGRRLLAEVPVGHRYVIDPGWPEECEVRVGADHVWLIPRSPRSD